MILKRTPALFITDREHEMNTESPTLAGDFLFCGRSIPVPCSSLQNAAMSIIRHYILNSEDDIDQFLDAFGIGPTETNRLIDTAQVQTETREQLAIQEFISGLTVDFPLSEEMSAAARNIQNSVYNHLEYIRTNPDRKIIEWTNTEYALFRAIEHARYGETISRGFDSVDSFITMANMVLNRRKSRAGKSLEHHLSAIFDGNSIAYSAQAVTEGNKKPDFIFPSQEAYHNATFPTDRLISLAAKTTCKDRWRQVINEADRLRGQAQISLHSSAGDFPCTDGRNAERKCNSCCSETVHLILSGRSSK